MRGPHRSLTLTTLAALALLAGCSPGQPQFREREGTADLITPAQRYVQEQLANHFGTPTASVAWERLPLQYHAATATIDDDPRTREFTVDISNQSLPIEPGDEVVWLSGELLQHPPAVVEQYDAETQTVILAAELPAAAASGDRIALGPGKVLKHGRLLYAEHCQHCHGVTGDGAGPTAEYLNPPPRDYRAGLFKFTSTDSTRRARRDDLARIIENGIPGTYMPSFKLLEPDESTAIIEYVLWLSMRGELELKLVELLTLDWSEEAAADVLPDELERAQERLARYNEDLPVYQSRLQGLERELAGAAGPRREEIQASIAYIADAIETIENNIRITDADLAEPGRITLRQFADQFDNLLLDTDDVVNQITTDWSVSQDEDSLVVPRIPRIPSDPASIARGREVYLSANAKCATCHGEAGLGNGEQTLLVQQGQTEPGLFDNWGNEIQPRNLTTGIYRGGRRPVDLFRRVHSGIKGTPMTGFGTALSEEDIWHVVNYVLSIPFEERETGAGGFVATETSSTQQMAATEPASTSVSDN